MFPDSKLKEHSFSPYWKFSKIYNYFAIALLFLIFMEGEAQYRERDRERKRERQSSFDPFVPNAPFFYP